MASATIPVDLRNPGQVFACLGFMEAAEILCGPCEGGFDYRNNEIHTTFTLSVDGDGNPVAEVLGFFRRAGVYALAPANSEFSTAEWGVETISPPDRADPAWFPSENPKSAAALPIILTDQIDTVPIDYWTDGTGRDNVKFWGGMAGRPGAAVVRDMLEPLRLIGDNAIESVVAEPFSFWAPQPSSLRFDWRRDYTALRAGFSPNDHKSTMRMVGYPLVEILAAAGLQHARPQRPFRACKLTYRYGAWREKLPIQLARALIGAESLGFAIRTFMIKLDWAGKEDQARCIIDAQEEFA